MTKDLACPLCTSAFTPLMEYYSPNVPFATDEYVAGYICTNDQCDGKWDEHGKYIGKAN